MKLVVEKLRDLQLEREGDDSFSQDHEESIAESSDSTFSANRLKRETVVDGLPRATSRNNSQ